MTTDTMSLEKVRDWHRKKEIEHALQITSRASEYHKAESQSHQAMADAIDAHLREGVKVDKLRGQFEQAKRDERHLTMQETFYWCGQYKLLCEAMLAATPQTDKGNKP